MPAQHAPTSQEGDPDGVPEPLRARVVLVALFSERYPAIGESHGISAIAGAARSRLGNRLQSLTLIDKVMTGVEDCSDAVDAIRSANANVLGISLQYGTYSVLKRELPQMRAAIIGGRSLVIFGGPLASYLGNELLQEIDSESIIVEGEGDAAFPKLVTAWLDDAPLDNIENTRLLGTRGQAVAGRRALGDLQAAEPPFRNHVREIAQHGGQIFIESSRGCSWAACTFCLRGLTDVKGRPNEYRRFSQARVFSDIRTLRNSGITTVTFADEDFLGGSLDSVAPFILGLTSFLRETSPEFVFDVSMTIDSVLGLRDSPDEALLRQDLLGRLKEAGLRKVFLGIESGSVTQLRRYAKGHRPENCAAAVRRLREIGVVVEVGFIMFDPLCSLTEIEQNLCFLRTENLVASVSALTNEMRLQHGSTYMRLLEREESRLGQLIYTRQLDRDTLSYQYRYVDPRVRELTDTLRRSQSQARDLVYPLKALTRYGDRGALADAANDVREILANVRQAQFNGLKASVDRLLSGEDCAEVYSQHLVPALEKAASELLDTVSQFGRSAAEHPVVLRVVEAGRKVRAGSLRTPITSQRTTSRMTEIDACDF
ncbi:radical SAM protein [Plantactinospora sp. S1510]|uniref:Radical SAM protein n=1 Tax=Plantactinospora alkalitolerans TaxID=2789879 RepID=A0ABS0GN58_9ACTN|nr:radical SAM protein [Plantactinospora alkalitolerans]MBF9127618.1 radical SAM protein [Plantactinospora alkalitolerans]